MTQVDLLLRGGMLVLPDQVVQADLAISDRTIVEFGPALTYAARTTIDATGLHIFPALIDSHVHFNEPGRTSWEGFASGGRALALGGGALCVDMPLNGSPPLLDAAAFTSRAAAAERHSPVDVAFWGGLTPDNLGALDELAACGVVGFKAFMSNSGIAEFAAVDEDSLYRGMQQAARLNLPVAVHAENDAITAAATARARATGRTSWRDYLDSRPIAAELVAISTALALAEETDCRLHIVHVSSGAGVTRIAEAVARGVAVTCETCPHYLVLTEDDLERLGAVAKCAPPLRPAAVVAELWEHLGAGLIDWVASDHSPAPPELKQASDAFAVWGGIAGCQTTLPLLLSRGYHLGALTLPQIAGLVAGNPARHLHLRDRGEIRAGAWADLALVDLDQHWHLRAEELAYRHQVSPFVGMELRGQVRHTIRRGEFVVRDGRSIVTGGGRVVRAG